MLYDYLKNKLSQNEFREFGPNTLIHEDDTDKIIIYITKENMVMIHDGTGVVHGMEMIQITEDPSNFDTKKDMEDWFNHKYLQRILGRF